MRFTRGSIWTLACCRLRRTQERLSHPGVGSTGQCRCDEVRHFATACISASQYGRDIQALCFRPGWRSGRTETRPRLNADLIICQALHVTPEDCMLLHVTYFGSEYESSPCQERDARLSCPACAEAPQGTARRGPSSHPNLGSRCSLEALCRPGPPAIARSRQQPA
jgi:hypothetical protein